MPEENKAQPAGVFKHLRIRNFKVGEFEFKNFHLSIDDEEAAEEFRVLVQKLPMSQKVNLVEIPQNAATPSAVKPIGSRVVRNSTGTSDYDAEKKERNPEPDTGSGGSKAVRGGLATDDMPNLVKKSAETLDLDTAPAESAHTGTPSTANVDGEDEGKKTETKSPAVTGGLAATLAKKKADAEAEKSKDSDSK